MLDGKVQGVGFRESVKTQADRLGLVGQVMNLKDGRVGVVCEGRQDSIEELVGKLRGSPGLATVDNASVSYSESDGEYDSFIVVRGDERSESAQMAKAGVEHLKTMTNVLNTMNGTLNTMNGTLNTMNGRLGNIEEGVNDIKEGVNDIKEGVNDIKEGVNGVKEGVQGVHDKLDVMNETNEKGFRRTQEEIRGVSDRLDVMNETTQEGFRRVRA